MGYRDWVPARGECMQHNTRISPSTAMAFTSTIRNAVEPADCALKSKPRADKSSDSTLVHIASGVCMVTQQQSTSHRHHDTGPTLTYVLTWCAYAVDEPERDSLFLSRLANR